MASPIESEKLKLAAQLESLRHAIAADVGVVADRSRAALDIFSSWVRLRRLLLGGAGLWLALRAVRKRRLPATLSVLVTALLRPAVRSWVRGKFRGLS